MLPKVEKVKKNNEDQNTDQPGLFDKENEKDRLHKKRRFVYIAMALTIGLSITFSIYSFFKNSNFNFKLPDFNFTVSEVKDSSLNLPESTQNWSIFSQKLDSDVVIYQKNQDTIFATQNLDSIKTKIDKNNFITSSSYTSSLPKGLKIKELIEEDKNNFFYFSKITLPGQTLILIVKIKDYSNLDQDKKLIPEVINQLYWYSLQK